MKRLLRENPLLLLFVVAGVGFLLGKVRVAGVSLGIAAVLFAGLAFGALDPSIALPELVQLLGLVLFVYTVGLGSGPGFFASLGGRGLRYNGLALLAIALAVGLAALAARILHLDSARAAGLLAGASTNTPALAGVLDALRARGDANASAPVVLYSIAYPMGVLVPLLVIALARRFRSRRAPPSAPIAARIVNATVRVTRERAVSELHAHEAVHVAFGRLRRGDVVRVVHDDEILREGDLVTIVGRESDLARVIGVLGEPAEPIDLDRRALDFRRIFVSDPAICRRPLHALALDKHYDAVITRVRRGDVDFIPDGTTELELGDRIRVIAPRGRLDEIAKVFGDSYKALAEIDVITFSAGIALGLLLGKVPIPLPGGRHFELGLAGGPLIVGLVLGRLGRIGPFVFTPPFSASLTLRQLGLVLFLAAVGTRSGWAFATAVRGGSALPILAAAAAIALVVATSAIALGRLMKIPSGVLLGVVAGIQTQPAILAFASEQTNDEAPNAGYATVYPLATIAKIIFAQGILAFL